MSQSLIQVWFTCDSADQKGLFEYAESVNQRIDSDSATWRFDTKLRALFLGSQTCKGGVSDPCKQTHSAFYVKTRLQTLWQPCFHWNFSVCHLYYIKTFRYYTNASSSVLSTKRKHLLSPCHLTKAQTHPSPQFYGSKRKRRQWVKVWFRSDSLVIQPIKKAFLNMLNQWIKELIQTQQPGGLIQNWELCFWALRLARGVLATPASKHTALFM